MVLGNAYGQNDFVRLCFAPSEMDEIKEGMDRIERFLSKLL